MPPNGKQSGRNRELRIETSGIPRPADNSQELGRLMAMKLGIIPKPTRPEQPRPEALIDEKLGNNELPIYEYLDEIVDLVNNNPVSIFVAETGSGKSTQIPQVLMAAGYKVVLTQPRRIAAEMLSKRIEDEVAEVLGRSAAQMFVGFQTAERRTITKDTRLSVVTDGLRLVQELGIFDREEVEKEPEVLIIDEVHERNKNIDVLIAWTQRLVSEGTNLRVVFTTATMDADKLARHYEKVGVKPPILEVPGRSFDIETIERPESTVADEVAKYAREGKNVLAFLPGLTEIDDAIATTQRILGSERHKFDFQRLHGQLTPMERSRVEEEAQGIRLVFATNVAETSITIPDVDVIVDSGLERRIDIHRLEGNESLQVGVISQASCIQRRGRCGRTKPGIYVSTRLDRRVKDYIPLMDRPVYGEPEILRTNIDRTVLKVACTRLDINDLDMLDNIKPEIIIQSKKALQILGALDDDYRITDRGMRMDAFPVRPSMSRMLVYGIENNFSEEVRTQLAAIAAAVESGGLPDYTRDSGTTWKKFVHDRTSDLLAQLDIFIASQDMSRLEMSENDLNQGSVERAHELYEKLLRRSNIKPGKTLISPSQEQKKQITDAIVAGMIDFVYVKQRGGHYARSSVLKGKIATEREIGDRSIVPARAADILVGIPYELAPPPHRPDLPEKHIIQEVTATTSAQLARVATELCEWTDTGELVWRAGVPHTVHRQKFRGTIETGHSREVAAEWSPKFAKELIEMSLQQPAGNLRTILDLKKRSEELWNLSGTSSRINQAAIEELMGIVSGLTKKSMPRKPMTVEKLDGLLAPYVDKFAKILPNSQEEARIRAASPDFIDYQGIGLPLAYNQGEPRIARITDEVKNYLKNTEGPLRLPDGRDIKIPHTVNKHTRRLTIEEFRVYRG